MRKSLVPTLKTIACLLFLSLLFGKKLLAQTVVINTGVAGAAANNAGPIYRSSASSAFDASRYSYLYTQDELAAVGIAPGSIISQVGWAKNNTATTTGGGIFRIYMKNSAAAAYSNATETWANLNSGSSLVYENLSQTIPATVSPSYITFLLTTPFVYTGGSLEIATEWDINGVAGNPSTGAFNWLWSTVQDRIYGTGQQTLAAAGTLSSTTNSISTITDRRPFIQITFGPNTGCFGTPTGGTAQSSATALCSSTIPFSLSVNGGTITGGLSYQWQSSGDNVNWNNIAGATSAGYTVSPGISTNTYYRREVSCGANSSNSSSVLVTVNAPAYTSLPFTESFETDWIDGCNTKDIPNNFWRNTPPTGNNSWRRNDDATTTNSGAWTSPTLGGYTPASSLGSFSARFHSYVATSGSKGQLDLHVNANSGASGKRLDFDYINTNGNDSLVIYLSTNGGVSFVRLDSLRTATEWKTKSIVFSSTSATTIIRFEATSDNGTTDFGLDNISIVNIPDCVGTPSGGTLVSSSANVCAGTPISFTITGATSALTSFGITYQWQQSTDGGANWTNIVGATAATYNSPGINVTTTFRRQTICAGNIGLSNAVVVTVAPVAYAPLPFTESFEAAWINGCDVSDLPNNFWRSSPSTGNNSWRRNDDASTTNSAVWVNPNLGVYTPGSSTGNYSARFHSYQASSGTKGQLNLHINANTGSTGKRLSFDYINTSGNDSLVISVSTDGGTSFIRLDSVRASTVWKTKNITFGSTSATTIIRFEATSDFGTTDIGLDNIHLVNVPDCAGVPAGGTTVSSSNSVCPGNTVSLSVTGSVDPSTIYGISFQWEQSTDGGTTWSSITGATGATYLSSAITTGISFRRQTICAGNIGASVPAVITVSTPSYAPMPFAESFEAAWLNICNVKDAPNNFWRGSPVTGNNSWRRNDDAPTTNSAVWGNPNLGAYTPTASAGVYSARFHSYQASSGTKGQLNLYLNAATASATKRISFDYINTTGNDSLVVYLSTDGGATFTRLDSSRASAIWRTKKLSFTSSSATTVLRFEATSDFGVTDIGLDNITVVDFPPCVGTPTGGTIAASATIVCPSTPFSLSVSGATDASGLTYQWQQSINGGSTWTNIASATDINYSSAGITVNTSFRRQILCGVNSSTSTEVAITINNPDYAALPFAESFENTWIDGCGIRDIPNNNWRNNPITGNNSWRRDDDGSAAGWPSNNGDYNPDGSDGLHSARFHSDLATSGTKGQLNLYLNANTASAQKRVSFDYINATGNDSLVILLSTDGGVTFARLDSVRTTDVWKTKTIEFTTTSATTVIRFEATSDNGTSDIGLDNINVTDFAPCSGAPVAGTAVSSSASVCSESFKLSLQGSTSANGITYQWQRSVDNNNWVDITGATNFTYTTSQTATTFYRALVSCGSETSASLSVQVFSPTLVSGTFTINNAVPTNIPAGTFNSFNAAYNYIKCGISGPVVFNVIDNVSNPAGPYVEQLTMIPVPGASAVNTVSFKGHGSTIAFNANVTGDRAIIKLRGADNIRFDSLIINANAGTYGYGVQLVSNADSNIISNCIINSNMDATTTNYGGIVINGSETGLTSTGSVLCDFNVFSNNTITGGYAGITMTASATGANGNNRFVGNIVKDYYQYGMYVAGSYGTFIENNSFSRPTRAIVTEFNGIYFTGISTSATISKNRFSNPFGGDLSSTDDFFGIYFTGVDATTGNENIVSNNLIFGVNGEGDQTGIYSAGSDNVWYIHNTIALDSAASASTLTTRGFYQTTLAGGLLFFNNMVTISRGGAGAKHAVYLNTATTGITADYNNYFLDSPAGTNSIGFFGSNQTSLNDWQQATTHDDNSLSRNPFYANPSTGDYKPTNGAVDDKGTNGGIDTDILTAPRSASTPDIGAYEFTALPCILPVVSGNTIFSDTTVCQNSPVRLNLTITSWGSGQTFQWQTATSAAGPWTNISGLLSDPDTTIITTVSLFYRAGVSCGATTVFSNAVQLIVSPALPTGVYTIDKGGVNTYVPGIAGGNFISFNAAKDAMSCGIIGGPVVFNVVSASGPYMEQLRLDSIAGVSAINTITFNGNGNTISFVNTTSAERAIIKLSGADHIIFDSLRIDASGGTANGYGVQLINNADSNTFRNCTILSSTTSTATSYAGVVINATEAGPISTGATLCDGNLFNNNTITGGYYGVTLMGNTTAAGYIANNRFTNNRIQDFYNYGFYIGGTFNTLIEGNTFSRPARATTATSVYGIYATAAVSNRLAISKNRFTHFFDAIANSTATFYGVYHNAVDASTGNEVIVSNNLIHTIESNGPVYGFYNSGSNNVFYYHNTISLDHAASTATGQTAGLYQTVAATGVFFKNNIVTIRRGGAGPKHVIYMNTVTGTEINANNNDYFVSGSNAHIGFRTANQTTLAQWRTASGQDALSFNLNPLYNDTLNGNYKPQLGAINNKGVNVDIATDIMNVTRSSTTPDMGAYEFDMVSCQNPPVAGTASVTPATGICLEVPIRLTVAGHSPLGTITFQWQISPNGTGNWTNIGQLQFFPDFDTVSTVSNFYRAAVTCDGVTTFTNVTQVNLNPLLLTGTYTINPANPISTTNFQTFQGAVDAMQCGITGQVVFNAAPGTYNEQINIPYIPNTSTVNTVTFQSGNGIASSVTLSYAGSGAANYTLRLDSTRNFTFRNMSFIATDATNGRAIDIMNEATNINFINNIITVPTVTSATTNVVGIYANTFKGRNILLRGNTINNGSRGIHFTGTSATALALSGHAIDSNKVNNAYHYGIYTEFTNRLRMVGNEVTFSAPTAVNAAGIYANYADTAFRLTGNSVVMNGNTATTAYGIYVQNSRSLRADSSIVASNTFIANNGNTGTIYGLTLSTSKAFNAVNNVVAINSAGATAYGLYSLNNTDNVNYYNNSVSLGTTAASGYAGYFSHTATSGTSLNNNIFSNTGGGRALYVNNPANFNSDYNMLHSSGANLVQVATGSTLNFATLKSWTSTWNWDRNSISYQPAFISNSDLRPDISNPDVWAMHGRGTQVVGNSYDFSNQPRSQTLLAGVPDLGAYEFLPSATPTALTATPTIPVANGTQTFSYGTDTVMRITWGAQAPPSLTVRRFSGVVPSGLLPNQDSMFFYTKVEIPGGANYSYAAKLYYITPWQGSIPEQYMIGLGRTTPSNAWVVGQNSRVDLNKKEISQDAIAYLDRFTGLLNPFAQPENDDSTSNRGKDFWVGYQRSNGFGTNPTAASAQDMVIYMGAGDQAATVTLTIEGTNGAPWTRTYNVPANSTLTSDPIPKLGADDARLFAEGRYNKKGIHIESNVPIVAYAHIYQSTNSGATMLMPSTVWGYEYYTLSSRQWYAPVSTAYPSSSAFHIVAQQDSTVVEINPSRPTLNGWVPNGGTQPNGSYLVRLNKGDVYQVLGATLSGSEGYDLTGSYVKSIEGSQGCFPIAVFAGSTRTGIGCGTSTGSSGDLVLQQVFPYQAWGTKYLVAPTSNQNGPTAASNMSVVYRVMVKDPTTIVKRNGTPLPLASMTPNRYYQFESSSVNGDYIESNKPVLVAQFMPSNGNCTNTTGDGDPEMFYISPVEQAIKKTQFYRNDRNNIDENFITLIIPTEGLSSLRIDGVNYSAYPAAERFVTPHTLNGYSIVTKRWAEGAGSSTVESDFAFTGIVYGLGTDESYGYNLGTLVKNLNNLSTINTTLNAGSPTGYTCKGAPFQITALLPLVPESLTFMFSGIPQLSPNANVTLTNPIPTDTVDVNGVQYYAFTLPQSYTLDSAGNISIPIQYTSPEIESCDHSKTGAIIVQSLPKPITNFQISYANGGLAGCEGDAVNLSGDLITSNGIALNQWQWTYAPGGTGGNPTGQNQTVTYPAAGSYAVTLRGVTADGCVSDTTKNVVINARPVVTAMNNNIQVCPADAVTMQVANPQAGVVYNWYTTATGGTPVSTGATYTVTPAALPVSYWLEGVSNGCASLTRVEIKIGQLPNLPNPVPTVTSSTATTVTFSWAAVPGAVTYQVSENNGTTWVAPSSGSTGLTHTVTGLGVLQQATLKVRALTANACQTSESPLVTGCANSAAAVTNPTQSVCVNTPVTFTVQSPVAGITYSWYTTATGGTPLATGTSFTTPNVLGTTTYYVQQASATCTGSTRTPVIVSVLPPLTAPVVTVVAKDVNSVTFGWTAVPNAASYLVSVRGGPWVAPSSGATGLTHVVTGLLPLDTVSIQVQAIGTIACQTGTSSAITGRALPDDIYIPNSFSPNGDGVNDQLLVYGYTLKDVQFTIFNQWGEKIFESRNQSIGWDGKHKGQPQPSGVYMYVARFVLKDGTNVDRKGSINLVR